MWSSNFLVVILFSPYRNNNLPCSHFSEPNFFLCRIKFQLFFFCLLTMQPNPPLSVSTLLWHRAVDQLPLYFSSHLSFSVIVITVAGLLRSCSNTEDRALGAHTLCSICIVYKVQVIYHSFWLITLCYIPLLLHANTFITILSDSCAIILICNIMFTYIIKVSNQCCYC